MCAAISGSASTARRASRSRASRFRRSALVGAPLTIGNGANWTTTNFTGGAGFGYRWNDWLRFDATWDYRNGPGGSRQATVVCPYGLTGVSSPAGVPLGFLYDTTNTCDASASVRQFDNAFLANAYFDVGTYYGFTPYVGGGLGMNMNTLTGNVNYNETANGQTYAANLTAVRAVSAGVGQHAGAGAGAATEHRLWAAILEPLDPLRPHGRWPGRSRPELATRSPPA